MVEYIGYDTVSPYYFSCYRGCWPEYSDLVLVSNYNEDPDSHRRLCLSWNMDVGVAMDSSCFDLDCLYHSFLGKLGVQAASRGVILLSSSQGRHIWKSCVNSEFGLHVVISVMIDERLPQDIHQEWQVSRWRWPRR